ncbi:MAG: sec-independent protein translocase protein TatC [Oligoflexia bacterium]|nr:MAG: sec-independent protein translocase protein TatC [Oligoflexia bacterium]
MSNSEQDQHSQSLIEHLTELRIRLKNALFGALVGMIACYNFTEDIFNIIRSPIQPYLKGGGLVFTAPMDKFIAHLKIAFFGGVILACPWIIYQAWKFVAPGLYQKEKKYALGFIFSGTVLFLLGVAFSYFLVFPMAFEFLMNYGGSIDTPMITIDQYLSFIVTTSIMFGVSFELPLVLTILGMLGVIDQRFLREKRRYAIVGLAGLSAVFTPPDLLSMVLMLVPMVALYEISVIIVGFFEKKKALAVGTT